MKRILVGVGLAGALVGSCMSNGALHASAAGYPAGLPYICYHIPSNVSAAQRAAIQARCNALAAGLQKHPSGVPSTGAGSVITGASVLAPSSLPTSGGGTPSTPSPAPLGIIGLALAAAGITLRKVLANR